VQLTCNSKFYRFLCANFPFKKEKIKINYEELLLNITEKNYENFVYKGVSWLKGIITSQDLKKEESLN